MSDKDIRKRTCRHLELFQEFCVLNNLEAQDSLNLVANALGNLLRNSGCPEHLIDKLGEVLAECLYAIDENIIFRNLEK